MVYDFDKKLRCVQGKSSIIVIFSVDVFCVTHSVGICIP